MELDPMLNPPHPRVLTPGQTYGWTVNLNGYYADRVRVELVEHSPTEDFEHVIVREVLSTENDGPVDNQHVYVGLRCSAPMSELR